jgi:serine phosphatase RsbU (regulator of sigma subunit)
VVFDPVSGRLRWANAGHDLPLLRTGPEVTPLRATGMPLGMMPGTRYQEESTEVPPGSSLLFHSDGVTEAHGPGREMFGGARLAALAARQLDGAALIGLLLDELHGFTGPDWEQEDDITLVVLERAAADPAVPRPVELGRSATEDVAVPLVAGAAAPAGLARRARLVVGERPARGSP